jgi:RNA polymerase sporulation-specific sigma factor
MNASTDMKREILMHLRSLKKARKDVSLHDPIGTDKEGNDMTASVYLFFIHPHFYYLPTR